MPADLRITLLHDRHVALGARMVPFAGWTMPLQYVGILEEHAAVRERVGLFDVSHLARVTVRGRDAADQIRSITTYDVRRLAPGTAHYSLYCNDDGGIADDVFIYRLQQDRWLIVHNAAFAGPDLQRVQRAAGDAAQDVTAETVMLALQGPLALAMLRDTLGPAVDGLKLHACAELAWRGATVLIARTGYTGEDGAECIANGVTGATLWDALHAAGAKPAGLGARDTLRLEAALPLAGHDIDATTHPYEAGLGWTVTLDDARAFTDRPFTGHDALVALQAATPVRRLTHLKASQRGVLRAGQAVRTEDGGRTLGALTSGAFSPTLRVGIGMAYLPPDLARPGTRLQVDVRGRALPVEVVRRPFYRRPL